MYIYTLRGGSCTLVPKVNIFMVAVNFAVFVYPSTFLDN